MPDKNEGLYHKYRVRRTDGKRIESGCLVLEYDDPNAIPAIKHFAKTVKGKGYEKLYQDLIEKVSRSFPVSVDDAFEVDELTYKCSKCGWSGSGRDLKHSDHCFDLCPECGIETYIIGTPSYEINFYCWPENACPF